MIRILKDIEELFVPREVSSPLKGKEMKSGKILKNAYVKIESEKILEVGENYKGEEEAEVISMKGKVCLPGLIDSHTHLVYGGSREHEFALKLQGKTYLEILAMGGGIHSTVKATRESSFETLYEKTKALALKMLSYGTTAIEVKSGYGLDRETELRQLEVIKKLNEELPIEFIPTYLGAHAMPKEYADNRSAYIDLVKEMNEEVKEKNLAEFVDVFCEEGAFSAEESYEILKQAKDLGFRLRIHSNEIKSIGGIEVAGKLKAHSAEHLMNISDEEIKILAASGVIGNLLPQTTLYLKEENYAPARKMLEHNMAITLSTDANPGSCPTGNIQMSMQLGSLYMGLEPMEVFNAVTKNASFSVGREDTIGDLKEGKFANLTFFDAPNLEYILYFFATNLVSDVFIKGERVVEDSVVRIK